MKRQNLTATLSYFKTIHLLMLYKIYIYIYAYTNMYMYIHIGIYIHIFMYVYTLGSIVINLPQFLSAYCIQFMLYHFVKA